MVKRLLLLSKYAFLTAASAMCYFYMQNKFCEGVIMKKWSWSKGKCPNVTHKFDDNFDVIKFGGIWYVYAMLAPKLGIRCVAVRYDVIPSGTRTRVSFTVVGDIFKSKDMVLKSVNRRFSKIKAFEGGSGEEQLEHRRGNPRLVTRFVPVTKESKALRKVTTEKIPRRDIVRGSILEDQTHKRKFNLQYSKKTYERRLSLGKESYIWIAATDYNSYAVLYSCSNLPTIYQHIEYMWMMVRKPHLDEGIEHDKSIQSSFWEVGKRFGHIHLEYLLINHTDCVYNI